MLWVLIRSAEALLMSTHNICFCWEIRKVFPDKNISCGYSLEVPSASYEYPQHMFLLRNKKGISRQKHKLWVLIRSAKALLMSTHNICFCWEIRKVFTDKNISCGYSLEVPSASYEYPQHMFLLRNKKGISIFRMEKSALSVAVFYMCFATFVA